MPEELWRCPLCKATNVVGSKKCSLCRRLFDGTEEKFAPPRIEVKEEDDWEEDSKVLKDLEHRMEKASREAARRTDSIAPLAGIQLVIPNNFLGWVKVGVIVLALAAALAIVRTMF